MTAPDGVAAVGVDGWKDGWVAAFVRDGRVAWRAYRQPAAERGAFAALLRDFPHATVAVDIPIGTVDGPRRSDPAAKQYLRGRGAGPSSIFSTPTTAMVEAWRGDADHAAAMRDVPRGQRVSIQAWHLIPKMVEVQAALDASDRVAHEAHPECSLRTLDDRIRAEPKKTGLGVALRLRALRELAGYEVDLLDAPPGVPADDLLDAVAVLWTALRVRGGTHRTLPGDPRPGEPVIHV